MYIQYIRFPECTFHHCMCVSQQSTKQQVEDLTKQKGDLEHVVVQKTQEIVGLSQNLEEEQNNVAALQRRIRELEARIEELEEDLENERALRKRVS